MRFTMPAALAAAALLAAPVPANAQRHPHHRFDRVRSHISLHVSRHDVLSGRRVTLAGRVLPRGARRVKLVVRGSGRTTVFRLRARGGAFALRWRPPATGGYRVRGFAAHGARTMAAASAARRVTAYGTAVASYYGPGLYGGALACGGTLQPGTLGLASRTLPCGSKVRLRYRGRTLTVPVVDRGPYVGGRDFDLTAATRERLRFPTTGTLLFSR